jgi:dCMP deaminase
MKRENYITWDEYFMRIAETSAQRSKDPKTQVGACIVNPDNKHILSIGYNGLPRGFSDDDISWEESEDFMLDKHTYVVHAEANAILNAHQELGGSTLYVSMFPCNECAKLIAQSGIRKVVYSDDKYRHKKKGQASQVILERAGIEVTQYKTGGK